jgi:hypothetical protein
MLHLENRFKGKSVTSLPFYKRKLANFYLKVTLLDRRATPTICQGLVIA